MQNMKHTIKVEIDNFTQIQFFGSGRIALAQAHAKLSLRTQVLEEDAVIAVLLCESSVTLKHG